MAQSERRRMLDEPSALRQPLALNGGQPVLPEGPPRWPGDSPAVGAALAHAVATGDWGGYDGPATKELCQWLRELTGLPHVMPVSSGTIAVELALRGLGVRSGDEVILPAYDFPGNFRAIEAIGARPVLVDIREQGWTLDPESLDATDNAVWSDNVRAVLVSHLHGESAPMRKIRETCDRQGVAVMEDACQAPGALIDGQTSGSWGDAAVLSFGGSKLLPAGRGGALVTRRPDSLQRATIFCERGNHAFPLSELQATALVAQRETFAAHQRRRAASVAHLRERLVELNVVGLRLVEAPPAGDSPAYYKVGCRLARGRTESIDQLSSRRDLWGARLRAEGVAIDAGFRGFASRTTNRCRRVGELNRAREIAAATLVLHHPVLLEPKETIDRVALAIAKVDRHEQS